MKIPRIALIACIACLCPGDGEAFMTWNEIHGTPAADELMAAVQDRGLARAPTYLIENEVFVGRQHLPMIHWILDGRRGPGPI